MDTDGRIWIHILLHLSSYKQKICSMFAMPIREVNVEQNIHVIKS